MEDLELIKEITYFVLPVMLIIGLIFLILKRSELFIKESELVDLKIENQKKESKLYDFAIKEKRKKISHEIEKLEKGESNENRKTR